uniref:Peptidase M12A domain-containing protein n=1 Tax=Ascaris lumbricoides TaxID=6252 RepID=A0A0M3HY84_ASCLU
MESRYDDAINHTLYASVGFLPSSEIEMPIIGMPIRERNEVVETRNCRSEEFLTGAYNNRVKDPFRKSYCEFNATYERFGHFFKPSSLTAHRTFTMLPGKVGYMRSFCENGTMAVQISRPNLFGQLNERA